jgi:hypothetical protein
VDCLFKVEVLRPDGKGRVHPVRAVNAKEAEAVVEEMLEPTFRGRPGSSGLTIVPALTPGPRTVQP